MKDENYVDQMGMATSCRFVNCSTPSLGLDEFAFQDKFFICHFHLRTSGDSWALENEIFAVMKKNIVNYTELLRSRLISLRSRCRVALKDSRFNKWLLWVTTHGDVSSHSFKLNTDYIWSKIDGTDKIGESPFSTWLDIGDLPSSPHVSQW